MKKTLLIMYLVVTLFMGVSIVSAYDSPNSLRVAFTGDNLINAWFLTDGGSTASITLTSDPADLKNWRVRKIQDIAGLTPGHSYSLIWQVVNDDNDSGYRPPGPSNPGGFLAEISANSFFDPSLWLSSPLWEVAWVPNNLSTPADFNALPWVQATSWGVNSGSGNIWSQNITGGSISDISSEAQWIWTAKNFTSDSPDTNDSVFVRVSSTVPVPEPTTMLLLGLGLTGIAGLRRKFQK